MFSFSFRIFTVTLWFLRIFCPRRLSFSFLFFPHFPFVPFFFPYFPLFFFFFPNLHYFLNLVCHFLRAPLPCSRTFCCPGTLTPFGAQGGGGGGGFRGPPLKKTTFPQEFCNEICTIYMYVCTINNHNSGEKINVVSFQNGGQITNFHFVSFRFWSKW